ncbi:hypothetical protein AB1Y20_013788 [Prymnesium parvum]|uniref:Uncharacterized protein n=1 Tax=Prymnesium parvum TaxID=97485 RepID=A0AB34IH99_PRYPA
MRPSERAAAHAAKIQAKERQRSLTPGPGTYDPEQHTNSCGHQHVFKSHSQRVYTEDASLGDPGAYDPLAYRSMGVQRSLSASSRRGHGGFGGSSAREMKMNLFGEGTPGPGQYDGYTPQQDSQRNSPSSAFRSNSPQRARPRSADTPGVGSYNPKPSWVEPSVVNASTGMSGHSRRFTEQKSETDADVGPGSYETHLNGSLSASIASRVSRASRSNAGFGTKSEGRGMPQAKALDVPGPGSYSWSRSSLNATNGHQSLFRSESHRLPSDEVESGDPGAYDPHTYMSMGTTASRSFCRSGKAGRGGFGGSSAREMKMNLFGEGTPGPGEYDAKKAVSLFEKMPSSAFRSNSPQRARARSSDTPGVGSYNPKPSWVEPSVVNASTGMSGHSRRFTEQKSETDADVGPGSYETHLNGSLSASIASRVSRASRSNAGFGTKSEGRGMPQAKALDVPGPGSYSWSRSSLNATNGHQSLFRSESHRLPSDEVESGDPGAYDPHTYMSMGTTASRSFCRSGKAGRGGFGGSSAREMKMNLFGEGTPGPGQYDGKIPQQDSQRNSPSSAFRSNSPQRARPRSADTPGVGSYNPKPSWVEPSVVNASTGMSGHSRRFTEQKSETDADVGPGSYETHLNGSLSASIASRVSRASRSNAGFGTKSEGRGMPQAKALDVPGPGSYSWSRSSLNATNGHQSLFRSESHRLPSDEVESGDPGAYDPHTYMSMGTTASRSFCRSGKAGRGGFGGSSAREMKMNLFGEGTPGPGQYDGKIPQQDSQRNSPSSAFRSSSPQRARPRGADTPGVGSYNPKPSWVEPSVVNASTGMSGHSRRFTEQKSETDADVGPGSYETHLNGSLSASIASRVSRASRSNAGFGTKSEGRGMPQAKALDVPGPGSYSWSRSSLNATNGHQSLFRSESHRLPSDEVESGDPGAYDPHTYMSMGTTASRSFCRSGKAGRGGFGGSSAREMKMNLFGEGTPGPGQYDGRLPQDRNQMSLPSSAFRSRAAQRAQLRNTGTPGVGSYHPNSSALEPSVVNAATGMRGHSRRFIEQKSETDAGVGPGAYDPDMTVNGSNATLSGQIAQRAKTGRSGSAVFASDSVRVMPY